MSTSALYMDATITPNRSLSRRGVRNIVVFTALMASIPFTAAILLGAPIPPFFLGLDVLGLWLALHLATRAKVKSERVQVSSETVKVLRGFRGRERPVWSSPTAFTRVELEGKEEDMRVWLRLSAQSVAVAAWLSPDERGDFAEALKDALRKARLERHPL